MTDTSNSIGSAFKKLNRTMTLKKYLGFALLVIALVTIGWGAIEGIRWVFKALSDLQKEVAAGIIAATATVTVSLMSVIFGRINEQKKMIEKDIRDKKTVIYEEVISSFMNFIISNTEYGRAHPEKFGDAIDKLMDIWLLGNPKMMIWASDDVLRKWSEFRSAAINISSDDNHTALMMLMTEDLILAIRKDLGHRNIQIPRGAILRLFINDLPH